MAIAKGHWVRTYVTQDITQNIVRYTMRAVVFFVLFYAASMADFDFNTKTRSFSIELLYHTLQDRNGDGDIAFSPYIIWSLLVSMAYETLGVTREQVSNVFLLTEDRSDFVELFMNLRNSVLVNESGNITLLDFIFYDKDLHLNPDGIRRLENDFHFVSKRLNFKNETEAVLTVYRTMEQCGIVRRFLVKTTDFADPSMIMYNCFTFKAKWLNPFNILSADKMYMKARLRFSNFESLHASVTELPYEGGKYCILLIRPHSGHDLEQVIRNLRGISIKGILNKLQSDADEFGIKEIEVELPVVTVSSRVIFNKPLINMGLSDVFDENSSNFDNFAKDKIYIYEIAQKAYISFQQYQTEVVAATPSFEMSGYISKGTIAVKDPFVFLIMEKSTATILFGGCYSIRNVY